MLLLLLLLCCVIVCCCFRSWRIVLMFVVFGSFAEHVYNMLFLSFRSFVIVLLLCDVSILQVFCGRQKGRQKNEKTECF